MSEVVYRLDGGEPLTAAAIDGSIRIGRAADSRIRIDDGAVSRHHAELAWAEGAWWVSDMGSASGTLLNGLPVPPARRIAPGDRITILGDSEHVVAIVSLPEGGGATRPRSSSTLKSMTLVVAERRVRIVLASGETVDAPIAPQEARLLGALLAARRNGTGLDRAAEQQLIDPGASDVKTALDQSRKRLRRWWVDLCKEHPALDAASPRATRPGDPTPEILILAGDARRLAVAVTAVAIE